MKESVVKNKILGVASRLFYTQGYNETGINQIIDEAGVVKATLYRHYPSKNDLLLDYLDHQKTFLSKGLQDFLEPVPGAKKKILAVFEFHAQMYQGNHFIGCPFLKIKAEVSPDEAAVWERVTAAKKRVRTLFGELVLELDNKTGLSTDALADMLAYLLEGSTVLSTVHKSVDDIRSAKKTLEYLL